MFKIKYRSPDETEWSVVTIPQDGFKHCYDDESVAIELYEYIVACFATSEMTEEEIEEKNSNLIFEDGDRWNDVIIPIFEERYADFQEENNEPDLLIWC